MGGCLKSCLGRIAVVALLGLAAGAAWLFAPTWLPELSQRFVAEQEGGPPPSSDLAEATIDRFERFRAGETGPRMTLGHAEVTSVVRYSVPGMVPEGVAEPTVVLHDGRVRLSGRVATGAFPAIPALEEVTGILPDTVDVQLRGSLLPFSDAWSALHVEAANAAGVRLPKRLVPPILRAMGREDRQGLPDDALLVPLPSGLRATYVEGDSLVLVAQR